MSKLDLHVLVVDDEVDARELLALMLERVVRRVVIAANAQEAFTEILAEPPDVLVSDICMPGEDGRSLVRRLRAVEDRRVGAIPAIAVTALATKEEMERTREAGFDLVLAKPVDVGAVVKAIEAAAERRARTPTRSSAIARRMRELVAGARSLAARVRDRKGQAVTAIAKGGVRVSPADELLVRAARLLGAPPGGRTPARVF